MTGAWFLLISAAVAAADQLLKRWVVSSIALGGQWPVIPGVLHLTYLQNTGAAHSMFQGMRWPLVVISSLCSVGIMGYLILSRAKTRAGVWSKVGMALVLGGAVGNLIDRIRLGYVVDMLEVEFIRYPVFNLADSCIVVGGILFCVLFLFFNSAAKQEEPRKKQKSAFPETGKLVSEEPDTVWTETKILEAYDLERMLEAGEAAPEDQDGKPDGDGETPEDGGEETPPEPAEDDRDL